MINKYVFFMYVCMYVCIFVYVCMNKEVRSDIWNISSHMPFHKYCI